MNIEFDWQIIEGERDELEAIAASPPPRPKRKLPRWLMAVALIPVVAAVVFGVYVTTTYRSQLARATQEVKVIAKLEAKAVATNDLPSLDVPQYYKPTASGWVHALPGADFWGPQQSLAGKRVLALYPRRDADVIEPLVLRMDPLLERVCAELNCPPQVTLTFETSPGAIGGGWSSVYGGGESTFTLRFLSPHLSGLPADDRSREELDRAFETRVVRGLVTENWPGQRPRFNSVTYQQLVRWQLAQAGLTGPFITPQITSTLATAMGDGAWQPLSAISLDSYSTRSETVTTAMVPLAFDFIAGRLGVDSLAKLTPAIANSPTLGDAIRTTLHVNPLSLESDWQAYLRAEAGLTPYVKTTLPRGELALECITGQSAASFSILRIHADGAGMTPMTDRDQSAFYPAWSPDGKRLAFAQGNQVAVIDASDRRVSTNILGSLRGVFGFGWLPDGQLWIDRGQAGGLFRVNVDTGQEVEIKGARPIALGYGSNGSPESWRLALVNHLNPRLSSQPVNSSAKIETVDVMSNTVATLAQALQEINWVSGPAWSPDGSMIAMTVWRSGGPTFLVLDSRTGVILEQKRGMTFSNRAWSADGRYVAFQPEPDSSFRAAVSLLDMQKDQLVSVLGNGWDWSPDGKWLAVTQNPSGVLITTPDMAVTHWLDTPSCSHVAWRPVS